MNSCKICHNPLNSLVAKVCKNKSCVSKWKMIRNQNLPLISKSCTECKSQFNTKDRRNNFCSSKCKAICSNKTKIEKYGTLSLESKESVLNRLDKLRKRKKKCGIDSCNKFSRTKGMCAGHYIIHSYLASDSGKETFRLNTQKRKHTLRSRKILSKSELNFLRTIQTTCAGCCVGGKLTADHHIPLSKGGDLSLFNTVLLCASCNSRKHNKMPEDFYSVEALKAINDRFNHIKSVKAALPYVYFLFGCFGSGKTWVANQLQHKFAVVEYDKHRELSIDVINSLIGDKPVLFVSPVKITPFINKFSMKYNIIPIALIEQTDVIESRLSQRGGILTENVTKRISRIESIANKYAQFLGTSQEVLDFLNKV